MLHRIGHWKGATLPRGTRCSPQGPEGGHDRVRHQITGDQGWTGVNRCGESSQHPWNDPCLALAGWEGQAAAVWQETIGTSGEGSALSSSAIVLNLCMCRCMISAKEYHWVRHGRAEEEWGASCPKRAEGLLRIRQPSTVSHPGLRSGNKPCRRGGAIRGRP
jgi:hypothetical protein